jgi:cytoskeletal protein CcmA (bactofilin family)
VAVPLLLTGSSATEGEVVAQSGEHPEHPAAYHQPVTRREVVCFDCRAVNKASAKATSTQCANCGTFIDLRDVEIRERSTQRIRTRGNVTVHKKGALLGTAVHCGSLIIEGSVAGSIYAQETVEFRTDAKILGEIRCRHLLIGKRLQVQGLQPIHVESMELQGTLTARVLAGGTVHLAKHSRLAGGVNAARMKMEHGAELEGIVRIGGRAGAGDEAGVPSSPSGGVR